ncbi:hypothetical protein [Pseudomonas sp.]|uniref:hypothetical protein n=1 Tax=Pseudomonas sp. TaxID=306 RepID=UPI003A974EFC
MHALSDHGSYLHGGAPSVCAGDKGLTFRTGQTHVHPLLARLLEPSQRGDLNPQIIISHRMPLARFSEPLAPARLSKSHGRRNRHSS